MNESELEQQHLAAAEASKGISHDAIYQMTLRLIEDHKLRGDLLDFGPGTGTLLGELIARKYDGKLTGADLLPRPASLPDTVGWIHADLNNRINSPDQSFDVIVSTEVIEHLENPRAVFREFFRLLRPKGSLIVTTPNQESLRSLLSLMFEGHFVAFKDSSYPAHITALVRMDLTRLCLEAGLAKPLFVYTDSGAIPKCPQVRWERLGLKGRLFSDGLAILARKP